MTIAFMVAVQQTWALSAQPTVRIGEVEAAQEYMFAQVGDAVRLADGRIAVANGGSSELRVYDAQGKHLRTMGRAGDGPGEFRTLRYLWRLRGDSLVAVDTRNGRLTFYGPGPTMLHTVQLPPIPAASGRLSDGSYIAALGLAPPDKINNFQGHIDFVGLVLRRASPTAAYDTIVRGKAGQSFVQPVGSSWRQYPYPYGRTAQIAIGNTRFYYGDTHSTEIGIYDTRGTRVGALKLRDGARALSGADIERWIEFEVAKRPNEQAKTDTRVALREIPAPRKTPEFAALKLDDDGNLWVRRYGPPWDPSRDWDVYDPNGRSLASARLPARFEPSHIGRDFVLGVSKDEFDVERIELYRLTR
ncbi:MAG: 6-bladed beta-propeller [Longimicrobiales bacterium]